MTPQLVPWRVFFIAAACLSSSHLFAQSGDGSSNSPLGSDSNDGFSNIGLVIPLPNNGRTPSGDPMEDPITHGRYIHQILAANPGATIGLPRSKRSSGNTLEELGYGVTIKYPVKNAMPTAPQPQPQIGTLRMGVSTNRRPNGVHDTYGPAFNDRRRNGDDRFGSTLPGFPPAFLKLQSPPLRFFGKIGEANIRGRNAN